MIGRFFTVNVGRHFRHMTFFRGEYFLPQRLRNTPKNFFFFSQDQFSLPLESFSSPSWCCLMFTGGICFLIFIIWQKPEFFAFYLCFLPSEPKIFVLTKTVPFISNHSFLCVQTNYFGLETIICDRALFHSLQICLESKHVTIYVFELQILVL